MTEKSIADILNSVCTVKNEPAHLREGLVQEIAHTLNDHRSVPYYRIVVLKFSGHEDVLFKCLGLTKETAELSVIKKSKGAIFTHLIKKEAKKLSIVL
jgi:uncharacterized protein (UPF0218 family)